MDFFGSQGSDQKTSANNDSFDMDFFRDSTLDPNQVQSPQPTPDMSSMFSNLGAMSGNQVNGQYFYVVAIVIRFFLFKAD